MNSTFSPVLVERFSTSIRSRGTPARSAIAANTSASGVVISCRVIEPRPPEKISSGAIPCRNSSAPRSATRVSWLHRTMMASAGETAWPRR